MLIISVILLDAFSLSSDWLYVQVCMMCSAGYHIFYCQSEVAFKRWLGLDLTGVSVGFCGILFPGAYYAFYCDQVRTQLVGTYYQE